MHQLHTALGCQAESLLCSFYTWIIILKAGLEGLIMSGTVSPEVMRIWGGFSSKGVGQVEVEQAHWREEEGPLGGRLRGKSDFLSAA
jgi:hypothetical protein